jgi:predicted secreted protein
MNIFSAIVIFVLCWWMVFFCALPFDIKPMEKPVGGSMSGAPIDPGLKKKLIITTAIAFVLWAAIYAVIRSDLISFHDIAQKMTM